MTASYVIVGVVDAGRCCWFVVSCGWLLGVVVELPVGQGWRKVLLLLFIRALSVGSFKWFGQNFDSQFPGFPISWIGPRQSKPILYFSGSTNRYHLFRQGKHE
jgi:hypothetical protein